MDIKSYNQTTMIQIILKTRTSKQLQPIQGGTDKLDDALHCTQ